MKNAPIIAGSLLVAVLTGCQQGPGKGEAGAGSGSPAAQNSIMDDGDASEAAVDEPKKSIIRPEIDTAPPPAPMIEAVDLTVPYPARGSSPDAAGRALLDGLLDEPVVKAGGKVTIWGHSDSRGSDAENLAASRRRADAARSYLEGKGIARSRITVIPLGEARPIAPNRKLDGSDDPEGRARNRRVEIRVDIPVAGPDPAAAPAHAPSSKAPGGT